MIGDNVMARVTIKELITEKRRAIFDTRCLVGDRVVVEGDATLMIDRRPSRAAAAE